MSEERKKICNFCDKAFERNNYYFGKLMKAQDFKIEQSYFNRKRWLINRMIHGWGVVCGLDVTPIKDESNKLSKISIEPGLAIDCYGREILVCEQREISLKPEAPACSDEGNVTQTGEETQYRICLKFKECQTEQFLLLDSTCDQKKKCQFNRIKDWFEIKVVQLYEQEENHFCPIEYDCTNKKSLHQLVCDWLIKCPECCDNSCVVLATVTLDENSEIKDINKDVDKYSDRKLVYNNSLLYDLISCYHGDLPRVCVTSWVHAGEPYSWDKFRDEVVPNGLQVTFNMPMNLDTINQHTFKVVTIAKDEKTGYRLHRYIPGKIVPSCDESSNDDAVTFVFDPGWVDDEVGEKGDSKSAAYSAIAHGAKFEIVLRGSSIFSKDGKALDGCFMGDFPSGAGTQGTDFISWFSVHSRHKPPKETYEENQSIEEEENEH